MTNDIIKTIVANGKSTGSEEQVNIFKLFRKFEKNNRMKIEKVF